MSKRESVVAIVHRSYANDPAVSHAGLGIAAINSSKTLNQKGVKSYVWGLSSSAELEEKLKNNSDLVTHVVIQAPWIQTPALQALGQKYPDIQFAVNCHSNVGFLQTEPGAVTRMLDLLELEQSSRNIHCAGNSEEFCNWIRDAYQSPCTLLPNLYYLDQYAETQRPLWNGGLLRIGIFGAPRPQKNMMTGVAGAIEIAQRLKAHTEIWINAGRNETNGKTILDAISRAIARNPFTTYKEFPWAPWPQFRRHIGSMNLLIQNSYSESFNQVTADGVAMGVPTVVSSAIRWAPHYWQADTDSALDIARVGRYLLLDPHAHRDGVRKLHAHNGRGFSAWKEFINGA